ncbi:MAG TPA: prenyltransferase/squalene oxidase repeat-containing protein [Jatrophihabitans sp.]|nr:prenyltransferase/squalene oxidase repeat-containing protein [Jatrophihabitans sp.]
MRLLRRRAVTVGAGLAAVTAVITSICAPAAAAPVSYTVTTDPVHAAAGWVATQFVDKTHLPAPDGDHFDSAFGGNFYPNYGENADVIFGLAAAKAARAKIDTALAYLEANADGYADFSKQQGGPFDGSIGKLALAAEVAGADPHHFAGHDLLKQLHDDECTAVSPSCAAPGAALNIFSSVSESLVVLAEARGGGAPSAAALAYLTSLQCTSGGFGKDPTPCGNGAADLDATSYAIMALAAVGGHATGIGKAVGWLKTQQKPGGYWISQNEPNANSTGLATAALQSQGADVRAARAWLRSQQVPAGRAGAGAIKYGGTVLATTKSATSPSVIATAQALTGLVDGGSLATVSAKGAQAAVPVFAPATTISTRSVHPGARLTVSGAGFVAGEKLQVSIHSASTTLATAATSGLGTAQVTVTVPTTLAAGPHTVVVTGTSSGLSASGQVTIVAAAPASTAPTTSAVVAATSATPEPGTPTLAATGQDSRRLAALSVVGIAAVFVGAALLLLGRRRRLD